MQRKQLVPCKQKNPVPSKNEEHAPYFRPEGLKNHTLWAGAYLYTTEVSPRHHASPFPLPPPRPPSIPH